MAKFRQCRPCEPNRLCSKRSKLSRRYKLSKLSKLYKLNKLCKRNKRSKLCNARAMHKCLCRRSLSAGILNDKRPCRKLEAFLLDSEQKRPSGRASVRVSVHRPLLWQLE